MRKKATILQQADAIIEMLAGKGTPSLLSYKIVVEELRRQLEHKALLELSVKEWRGRCKQVQKICQDNTAELSQADILIAVVLTEPISASWLRDARKFLEKRWTKAPATST